MLTFSFVAWWIAFGPHGPRAGSPPGEWTKIWLYTAVGVGASAALFFFIHSFARPPPRTMTKEWQEATNEYLLVGPFLCWLSTSEILTRARVNVSILFMVSAAKATRARVSCKANLRRLKGSVSNRMNRRIDQFNFVTPLLQVFVDGMHD